MILNLMQIYFNLSQIDFYFLKEKSFLSFNGNLFDFLKEKIILMLSMEWKMNPFLISPNHPNQWQKGGCSQNIQSFAMIYNVFDLIGSCCRFGGFCRSKATFVWFCKINDKSDFSETYIQISVFILKKIHFCDSRNQLKANSFWLIMNKVHFFVIDSKELR